MKILLTGATSFIGRHLAAELVNRKNEVYVLVRPDSKNKDSCDFKRMTVIKQDMNSIEELEYNRFPNIDVCIHLAWAGKGIEGRMDLAVQRLNIKNTLNLISLAQIAGCKRFIFAGSQAEYGVTLERIGREGFDKKYVYDENLVCTPVSEYGKAKLRILQNACILCEDMDMEYMHLRLFSIYGEGDHPTSLINTCVKSLLADKEITLGRCSQLWNYLHVSDCVSVIADLTDCRFMPGRSEESHVVNIAGEDTRALKDFVLEIEEVLGKKGKASFTGKDERKEGIPHLNPSINRLKKLTGFKPEVGFRKGIQLLEKMYSMSGEN